MSQRHLAYCLHREDYSNNMILKRIFDLGFIIPGILVLSPILLIIVIVIKLDSHGPIIFKQRRVGLSGKMFDIFKFRTMVQNAEEIGEKLTVTNDPRITKSGKWLRKSKLDELPQLFNVLIGNMSLVGPRPDTPEHIEFYSDKQKQIILSVLPGMTDTASIEFRDEEDISAKSTDPVNDYKHIILPIKLPYYIQYVEQHSLWGDFKLIIRTIMILARSS